MHNGIGWLKFFIVLLGFWHNQTYERFCVYNENEYQVYNEINTSAWWWKQ